MRLPLTDELPQLSQNASPVSRLPLALDLSQASGAPSSLFDDSRVAMLYALAEQSADHDPMVLHDRQQSSRPSQPSYLGVCHAGRAVTVSLRSSQAPVSADGFAPGPFTVLMDDGTALTHVIPRDSVESRASDNSGAVPSGTIEELIQLFSPVEASDRTSRPYSVAPVTTPPPPTAFVESMRLDQQQHSRRRQILRPAPVVPCAE